MRKPGNRLGAVLSVCAAAVLLGPVGTASAARGLVTGFDDPLFESSNAGERALWLDRSVQSGAGLVRLQVTWGDVALSEPLDPANPGSVAYKFGSVDASVRDARARGLRVMLVVVGAPSWAEGPDRPPDVTPGTWKPSPASLADFMKAVAARYSGGFDPDGPGPAPPLPAAQAIQVWNEPNLLEDLTPQYEGSTPVSPDHYRMMLNASYAAVKSVNPSMLVVTAGTAPYGGPSAKGLRVRPVEFDRVLLCVRQVKPKRQPKRSKRNRNRRKAPPRFVRAGGCAGPVNFDVLAHHPINTSGGPRLAAINPDDASSADLGRITRVLRGAERVGTVSSGRHPIWATEMWWDSNPPNPAGAPLARHARRIEEAMFLAWQGGASAVLNLRIRDAVSPAVPSLNGDQSGLYFVNEQAKPALRAFRFPFVTERTGKARLLAWGRSPDQGKLVIQRRTGGRWKVARKLEVRAGGVFAVKLRLRGKQRLRASVGGIRSLVWKQT